MKFNKVDEMYLSRRKVFSADSGLRELWSVIDHWPLYVGISNLARFMAIGELLKESLDVPGHIAEFGSWRGANLLFMAKLLRIYDPSSGKQVHCFEGFEGLQTFSEKDGESKVSHSGAYLGNYDELLAMIDLYDLSDDVVIHSGDILKTLPDALADESLSFSLVYCDTDLYEPTQLILSKLHSRLSKGGMFILDEWNYSDWPGETTAVREFLQEYGNEYEMKHVKYTLQPSLILRRIS